jgi:hypothetical protein
VLERWRKLNPDYEVDVLDSDRAFAIFSDMPGLNPESLPPAAFSDILRVRLLAETGGVWVDATTLPTQALDTWLPELTRPAGWFAFSNAAADRLIASWFLAATPGHPVMAAWWRETQRFWARPRIQRKGFPEDPVASVTPGTDDNGFRYFWFHYLFAYLVETSPEINQIWSKTPKVSAGNATLQFKLAKYSRLSRLGIYPTRAWMRSCLEAAPVHKLNRHHKYNIRFIERQADQIMRHKFQT